MARIKYAWTGRPKNVSRREYEHYSLLNFGAIACGGFSFICFIAVVMGLPHRNSERLAAIPSLSVSEALEYKGDRSDAFKLQGRLIADPPLVMPDDTNLNVIAGNVNIQAKDLDENLEPVTLWQWQEESPQIFLDQGSDRIPFNLDLSILPLETDNFVDRELIYAGESIRTQRVIAVEYNDQRYPLPANYLELNDNPSIKVNRQYFINGQTILLIAGVENTGAGARLVPPLGQKASLWIGTEESIQASGFAAIPMLIAFGIGGAIASYFLYGKYRRAKAEIIAKSNQF